MSEPSNRRRFDREPLPVDVDRGELPPQDLDAEQACLGAMLQASPQAGDIAQTIEPRDFYRDSHQRICIACFTLLEHRQPCDLVTVAGELRRTGHLEAIGGFDYLDRLHHSTPLSENAGAYARRVRTLAVARRALFGARDVAKTCLHYGVDDPTAHIGKIETDLRRLADVVKAEAPRPAYACDALACSEAWSAGQAISDVVIETKWPTLDRWLLGGVQRPETHLIMARGGSGKTSVAVYLEACAMVQGYRVGHIALELRQANVTSRLYSVLSAIDQSGPDVPLYALRGGLPTRPDWRERAEKIDAWVRRTQRWNVVDFTQVDRSLYAVQQAIRYLAEDRGCHLVTVDNFNNVVAPRMSGFEAGEAVATMLDDATKQQQIPIAVCCQQGSHGGVYMAPRLFHDAGVVLELDRPLGSTEAICRITKNREGAGEGRFPLIGCRDTYTWREGESFADEPDQPKLPAPDPDDDPFKDYRT